MTLRETGVEVGVAVSTSRLPQPEYAELAAREFNAATPENAMKWDTTEPSAGEFNFVPADRVVEFAEANDMVVRGHALVWHRQLPAWVDELTGADAVRSAMAHHIEEVVTHFREAYPGRVVAWDVVNEALNSNDGVVGYEESVFYRELGEGYIAEAFAMAHQADPDARLYYNDYGIEGLGNKSTATLEMIQQLVESGVPIHGVGFQMHTQALDGHPELEEFRANLERYANLGVEVNISEMDASICRVAGSLQERFRVQRIRYNQIAGACLTSGNCSTITIWGLHDSASWLNSEAPCDDPGFTPSPLLFDDDYQRKPAWAGLMDALLGCNY